MQSLSYLEKHLQAVLTLYVILMNGSPIWFYNFLYIEY